MTGEELKQSLYYDLETGEFTRLTASGGALVGDQAGTITTYGYRQISVRGHIYLAHRLAWLYVKGSWPKEDIDHINHILDDNRFENLREASRSQSLYNRRDARKPSASGIRGVYVYRGAHGDRYYPQIKVDGRLISLGWFKSLDEAAAVRAEATRKYHGEFAFQAAPGMAGGAAPPSGAAGAPGAPSPPAGLAAGS